MGRQKVVTVRVEEPFVPAHDGRVSADAEAASPPPEGVALPPVEAYVARDGLGVEPEGARVRTRAKDVYQTAKLLGSAVREEIDVTDRRQEAKQAAVRVNDLHVFRVAARYPGTRTGQIEAGKSRVQSWNDGIRALSRTWIGNRRHPNRLLSRRLTHDVFHGAVDETGTHSDHVSAKRVADERGP